VSKVPCQITEKAFLAQVRYLARQFGWMEYHTHRSDRSTPGFPDLCLCRPPSIMMAELKTETGKLTEAQKQWLEAFSACGIETHVWRPADMAVIIERLRPKG
jgi:VRR-NUC domain